jgi:hypothetical protein
MTGKLPALRSCSSGADVTYGHVPLTSDPEGGFKKMDNRVKRSFKVSLMFAFIIFFLSGLLYFSPAYGDSGETQSIYQTSVAIDSQDEETPGSSDSGSGPTPKLSYISFNEISSESIESLPFQKVSGFDAFNANFQNQWTASFSKKTGKVTLLYGFRSRQYPDGPENVAREFLKESRTLFGMKKDLSDLEVIRVNRTFARTHVKLQQTYNGIPIAGVFVLVHSNRENQVTMVQSNYIEEFQPSNQEQLPAESAMEIARNDLQTNLGNHAVLSSAKAERLIAPYQGAYYHVWNVMISASNPLGLWVYRVDASNGQILHKSNQIRSLSGYGHVYNTNADFFSGKITNQILPNLLPPSATNWTGYLFGAHAAIYNYQGDATATPLPYANTFIYNLADDPFAANLHFYYDPVDTNANTDFFNAANGYYKLNLIWNWWNQNVTKYVNNKTYPDFRNYVPHFTDNYPIPVIVNETANAACSSLYEPDIYGNSSMQPGFIFGNENTCKAPIVPVSFANNDFVLDEDIVAHEFTHFMVDQCGFTQTGDQFDPTSEYGDAMNEGNADFFAFLRTKNLLMGDVICVASTSSAWPCDASPTPPYYMRSVNNTHIYPTDVIDQDPNDPSYGGPEPHWTGQIWSGYLYDLYNILGNQTLGYVFKGFYYFNSSNSTLQAEKFAGGAYAEYLAEKDVNPQVPLSRMATGAEASRGLSVAARPSSLFGPCLDGPVGTFWIFPPTKSINTKGYLHNPGDWHEYWVEAVNPGMNLTVTVTSGVAPKMIEPVISLYFIGRNNQGVIIPDPTNTTCAAVSLLTTVGPGSNSTTTQLSWPNLGAGSYGGLPWEGGLYSIVVTGTNFGNYNFSLTLQ